MLVHRRKNRTNRHTESEKLAFFLISAAKIGLFPNPDKKSPKKMQF